MRLKPITLSPIALGAVLVIALCGATPPADEPSEAAATASSETASEPAITPPSDGVSAAPAESAPDGAVLQAPETSPPAGEDAPPPETAASTPSADTPTVPAKGKPPTREYFVGVWAEQGKSCDTALDFKADGTLIGPFPRWELSDTGELTMAGNRQKIFLTVIDANTMQSRRAPNDPPRTLKRCAGG